MKLIAIDMDDTLLNSKKEISQVNIDKIKEVSNLDDCYVYICSGRSEDDINDFFERYDFQIPRVGSNGAIGYDGNKKLFEAGFDFSKAKELYENLSKYPLIIYTNSGRYLTKNFYENTKYLYSITTDNLYGEKPNTFLHYLNSFEHKEIDNLEDIPNYENTLFLKFFLFMPIMNEKIKIKKYLSTVQNITFTESGITNVEITPDRVNKGEVYKKLEKILNLKTSTKIAIGDSLNDYEMFEIADYGFAVKNAYPQILEIADYIVSSNDDNGVAEALDIIKNL